MTEKHVITLHTGAAMPLLGLGTYKAPKELVGAAVEHALVTSGYAQVDCAPIYKNEKEVGVSFHAIFESGKRNREDVFVTSKLWNSNHAKDDVLTACKRTLQDLQLDYLDLYLMHWGIATPHDLGDEPVDAQGNLLLSNVSIRETWEAMEALVDAGLVKAIGVSNFTAVMLFDLLTYARIKPAVNQIELHPYNQQTKLVEFCQYHGICVTAYSPLGTQPSVRGKKPVLLADPLIQTIAQHHGKTPSQILLRWALERKTVVIPKSTTPEHIEENAHVFDFTLSEDDLRQIATLDKGLRYLDPYEWWRMPYFG